MKHKLTVLESGSKKKEFKLSKNGIKKTWEQYEREMTVDITCTCGRDFKDMIKAREHLQKMKNQKEI